MRDFTTVKAHAAARQKGSGLLECLIHSRGSFSTKVYGVIDALGNCVHLDLTPGEPADYLLVPDLLAALPEKPGKVLSDKAYGPNAVQAAIAAHQAQPVIPPKSNRLVQRDHNENLYEDRNKIERCFGRFK